MLKSSYNSRKLDTYLRTYNGSPKLIVFHEMKLICYICVIIMKVRLVTINTVRKYRTENAGSRASFATWLTALNNADWNTINDIRNTFNSADIIGENRIVFNLNNEQYTVSKY